MSSFTKKLIVTPTKDGKKWIIERAFEYYVGNKSNNDVVSVYKGYVSDFASIPRIFWSILPPFGKYTQAAVLHDFLCDTRTRGSTESHKIFLQAMEVLGVSKVKRTMMYWAVRWFGSKW